MKKTFLILAVLFALRLPAAVFYVDSERGSDGFTGLSMDQAWKGLEVVNRQAFQPGDLILFKAGTHYSGQFAPKGSGTAAAPIRVGGFGEGPKARIDGEGKFRDAVLLRNVDFWELVDLEVTNQGQEREPWRTGLRILSEGVEVMRHIHVGRFYVHEVNGDLRKSHEGCGILFESRKGSHFEDLMIEDCHVVRTDRNGICQLGGRARSLGVVVRGNLLEDIGGDGIKIWGSDGALVEHNVLRGGRRRCEDAAAGIWPFSCDNTVVQFNEVSGMKGTIDGQGFDSDYWCRNSIFQYNYSHDNEGGFMLICSPGYAYCEGTIIRYNISENDGVETARVIQFGGGSSNTFIYNNVIYTGARQRVPLIACNDWDKGNASGMFLYNNIFYVEGEVSYRWGQSSNHVFENNVFYGRHVGKPEDGTGSTNRPALAGPGSGREGYRLQEGAELPKGRTILNNGGRDFYGNAVRTNGPSCAGIFERK